MVGYIYIVYIYYIIINETHQELILSFEIGWSKLKTFVTDHRDLPYCRSTLCTVDPVVTSVNNIIIEKLSLFKNEATPCSCVSSLSPLDDVPLWDWVRADDDDEHARKAAGV